MWVALGVLALVWLLSTLWQANADKWEGRVQDALREGKSADSVASARGDSLRLLADSAQQLKDSVAALEALPARLKIVTRTVREGFPTDTTAQDSLRRAMKVIVFLDSTVTAQDSVIVLQRRQIGVLGGQGHLWAAQRTDDSTRIVRLTNLLEDRPKSRLFGFLPIPKCGIGAGGVLSVAGKAQAGLLAGCLIPL